MDNLSPPIAMAENAPLPRFKNWNECLKALKKLPNPSAEADRNTIALRLRNSTDRLFIAFEFLWWRLNTGASARYAWLELEILQILGNGDEPPKLDLLNNPADVGRWVFKELRDVNDQAGWKQYVAAGRHLWLFYAILQCSQNKPALIEALVALSECLEHAHNAPVNGKPKKSHVDTSHPRWIAQLIKSRLSPKSVLTKAFNETVFALNAAAGIANDLREELNPLRIQIQKLKESLESETAAKTQLETSVTELQAQLTNLKDHLTKTENELAEEKNHTIRTGGFSKAAKKETINEVMALVRGGVSHRLRDIHNYADREQPNRREIVDLVGEIESKLAAVEEHFKQ